MRVRLSGLWNANSTDLFARISKARHEAALAAKFEGAQRRRSFQKTLCFVARMRLVDGWLFLLLVAPAHGDHGDYDQRTALHLAASDGHFDVVVCLVEELQADPSPLDRWGGTPLDDALRTGKVAVAKYLSERGGERGSGRDPATELCRAAASGDLDQLRSLAAGGTDVNLADYDRRTAIHLAASEGLLDVVVCLVEELKASANPVDR